MKDHGNPHSLRVKDFTFMPDECHNPAQFLVIDSELEVQAFWATGSCAEGTAQLPQEGKA
jgi:hypothetical protein